MLVYEYFTREEIEKGGLTSEEINAFNDYLVKEFFKDTPVYLKAIENSKKVFDML